MNLFHEFTRNITRRHFFAAGSHALGWASLASLLADGRAGAAGANDAAAVKTHFPAKAKHVIYLHMVGGPAQMDLYDYKPKMGEWFDKDLPDSVR
ncbi:MAG TPA: sulfatase, partial [Gemmataceae bacterium]